MGVRIDLNGAQGELRLGGRTVARLWNWRLKVRAEGYKLTARMTEADDYWLEHGGPYQAQLGSTWQVQGEIERDGDEMVMRGTGKPTSI